MFSPACKNQDCLLSDCHPVLFTGARRVTASNNRSGRHTFPEQKSSNFVYFYMQLAISKKPLQKNLSFFKLLSFLSNYLMVVSGKELIWYV